MGRNKKIKKGKLALLALAGTALIASLVYDKKNKGEENSEIDLPDEEITEDNIDCKE